MNDDVIRKTEKYLGILAVVILCILIIVILYLLLRPKSHNPSFSPEQMAVVTTPTPTPTSTTAMQTLQTMPPLSSANEAMLQAQLQKIVAEGNESECASLNDLRYQFACQDFFTIKKK